MIVVPLFSGRKHVMDNYFHQNWSFTIKSSPSIRFALTLIRVKFGIECARCSNRSFPTARSSQFQKRVDFDSRFDVTGKFHK
jgi:hypothetical protein